MRPGPKEMERVCLGPGGLVEHLRPGALYIDHTTNAPALVRRVHTLLAAKDVMMLDAPVSGGMEGAQTRDLLVMAGGAAAAFERARPILDAIAKRVGVATYARDGGGRAMFVTDPDHYTIEIFVR